MATAVSDVAEGAPFPAGFEPAGSIGVHELTDAAPGVFFQAEPELLVFTFI